MPEEVRQWKEGRHLEHDQHSGQALVFRQLEQALAFQRPEYALALLHFRRACNGIFLKLTAGL